MKVFIGMVIGSVVTIVIVVFVVPMFFSFSLMDMLLPSHPSASQVSEIVTDFLSTEDTQESASSPKNVEDKGTVSATTTNISSSTVRSFSLTPAQADALRFIGLDISKIPNPIPPAMIDCFVKTLGQERVDEIIAGAVPGPVELFKASSCISP